MNMNSAPGSSTENLEGWDQFSTLAADSIAGPILERIALEYLQTEDAEYLRSVSEGIEEGHIIKKDTHEKLKPSTFISTMPAQAKIVQRTKAEMKN